MIIQICDLNYYGIQFFHFFFRYFQIKPRPCNQLKIYIEIQSNNSLQLLIPIILFFTSLSFIKQDPFLTGRLTNSLKKKKKGGGSNKNFLYTTYNREKEISRSHIYFNFELWKYDTLFHCKNFLLNKASFYINR